LIRKIQAKDKDIFIRLTKDFYQSDAVLSQIPSEHIEQTFFKIIENSPYVDGYFYILKGQVVAYFLLSFTYSNELGGKILLLEELYVIPALQGKKIGTRILDFIEKTYSNKVTAIRLEVVKSNEIAKNMYYKQGFKDIKYQQLVKKIKQEE